MKVFFKIWLFNCITFSVAAQETLTPVQYIELYKDIAVSEMKRTGVPAAITLAQGILETESGNSILVKKSNNHFGIKCKSTWTAESVTHDDDAKGECFRAYQSAEESYRDHSNFLRSNQRYAFLFNLDVTDYKAWAYGLKKAGYATNPKYPQILIKQIEQYNLQQYTFIGEREVGRYELGKYTGGKEDSDDISRSANELPETNKEDILQNSFDKSGKTIIINGSKCVFANKGTSMLVIATKNNIPLSKLLSINEFINDGLLIKNQFVYLEKKAKTGDNDFYIAKTGESLYDIAQNTGIQLQFMLDYNKLWGNEEVTPGTKIYLKPALLPLKKSSNLIEEEENIKIHIVQPKEGLYAIARKYNITVLQLREWNNLQTDTLTVGQELIISK